MAMTEEMKALAKSEADKCIAAVYFDKKYDKTKLLAHMISSPFKGKFCPTFVIDNPDLIGDTCVFGLASSKVLSEKTKDSKVSLKSLISLKKDISSFDNLMEQFTYQLDRSLDREYSSKTTSSLKFNFEGLKKDISGLSTQCRVFDYYFLVFFRSAYVRTQIKDTTNFEEFDWLQASHLGLGFLIDMGDFMICCTRPVAHRDERGFLHNESGPAIDWEGTKKYYIHNVEVPENCVENPASITLEQINKESNAEVKRILIDRMGWDKYLTGINAKVLDSRQNEIDSTHEELMDGGEFGRILIGHCPSTGRMYSMRVPREVNTCVEAQKWLSVKDGIRIIGTS